MVHRDQFSPRLMRPASLALAVAVALATLVGFSSASHADVSAVQGSAFGYHAYDLDIFGPYPEAGPAPTVTLASDASNSPQTATEGSAAVFAGPAAIFTSGPITVSTAGSVGPGGFVTSSTDVENVNRGGQEVFDADRVQSTCTASEAGVVGSTTITEGTLRTRAQHPDGNEGIVEIPENPPANHTVEGNLYVGSWVESFRYVFNEQIEHPDGSLTVNAVHAYFLGPNALTGELIVGQSVCGVTAAERTDPRTRQDCKGGGWQDHGFRNQGQCIRFVNTSGDSR